MTETQLKRRTLTLIDPVLVSVIELCDKASGGESLKGNIDELHRILDNLSFELKLLKKEYKDESS